MKKGDYVRIVKLRPHYNEKYPEYLNKIGVIFANTLNDTYVVQFQNGEFKVFYKEELEEALQ